MEKFQALEPVKLYGSAASAVSSLNPYASSSKPSKGPASRPAQPLLGKLPLNLHSHILAYTALPDIASYARCCRTSSRLVKDEEGQAWRVKWRALRVEDGLEEVLDALEGKFSEKQIGLPPMINVGDADDDFGDFAGPSALPQTGGIDDLSFGFNTFTTPPKTTKWKLMRAHRLLRPLTRHLSSPPHLVLTQIAEAVSSSSGSLLLQAKTLRLLGNYLHPSSPVRPLRNHSALHAPLHASLDRFEAHVLAQFEASDTRGDEASMRECAESGWIVFSRDPFTSSTPTTTSKPRTSLGGAGVRASMLVGGGIGIGVPGASSSSPAADWELGKVWMEKRSIFYEGVGGKWDALHNFGKNNTLSFEAMDAFMGWVLANVREHGTRAVRVFPPESGVLIGFAERVAHEVVGEYISALLAHARQLGTEIYLQSVAASFKEAWRLVDAIIESSRAREADDWTGERVNSEKIVRRERAEDIIYQMFEPNMDEYLDEEVEASKLSFEASLREWEKREFSTSPTSTHFLTSQNPAAVKRNVVATFTNLLLLPVTIVPLTVNAVGGALMTGGSAAVQGIAMLNPQRWGAAASNNSQSSNGYSRGLGDGESLFDAADGDDGDNRGGSSTPTNTAPSNGGGNGKGASANGLRPPALSLEYDPTSPSPLINSSAPPSALSTAGTPETRQLDLLLSLDLSLELIHKDRTALKRVETFAGYPGFYGHRVKDTIEELFILFLSALEVGHISKGFARATERMHTYNPSDHISSASSNQEKSNISNVAPLEQFFELVHIGDTIQSMVQVYFDKELAPHIDRTDFLNAVVREKKKFENALDDSVAAGLNAGTEVLMNQVDHIITTLTKPREYYPPEDGPLDLGPTLACREAIKCLETHCNLLKGSTSKEVLEVFYQEVGIRLISILQKHIKRQIISLNGGFQVIADLNAYNDFIGRLKVAQLSSDFANLRMLGHVYVVEDAKDLAQIVKDVTRYGGAYRPEDIYEFIQRRSDWKRIEKIVDKTMYNLSFKEDCCIM